MIRQVTTKLTSTASVIRSSAFVKGFSEIKSGKPLNYDAFPNSVNKQWDYERGRQFGLLFQGKIKNGARVTYNAELMFGIELNRKSII